MPGNQICVLLIILCAKPDINRDPKVVPQSRPTPHFKPTTNIMACSYLAASKHWKHNLCGRVMFCLSFVRVWHLVREEKHLKLLRYVSGSGVYNLYVHNVFSPSMTFSDDGSLFAYFDGSKSVLFCITFVLIDYDCFIGLL